MQETQEMPLRSLGWKDPLEKGTATHFSILAWKIPRTEEPGGLQSMGLQRVRHHLVTEHTHTRDFYGAKPNPENEKTALRFQSEVGAPWWHHDTIVGKIPRKKCNSPSVQFSSVQFSRSVVSDSLRPHESQHTRPPCPSPSPGVHSNSRPSSR